MTPAPPLRVFIADDEAPARRRLRELLGDCARDMSLEFAGEAANGREALERIQDARADVVLLDIRMPVMDGLELAGHLQRMPVPPAVVFVTAYDVHAVQAFELNALDYLVKPVRPDRLARALARAREARAPKPEVLRGLKEGARVHFSVQERGRVLLVPAADVIYLKAELKYVTARTAVREYLLEDTLVQIEQEFGERFVRIHRNCLVARDAVAGFERVAAEGDGHWIILLRGTDERLPVSRRQHHVVKELARG